MKKLFLIFILLFSAIINSNAETPDSCNGVTIDDKLSLSNCVNEEAKKQAGFIVASWFVAKRNFEYAASVFSSWVDIDTEGYKDNESRNKVISEPILYAIKLALYVVAYFIMFYMISGLLEQAKTGKSIVFGNLYVLPLLFGGGILLMSTFLDFIQILLACGIFILLMVVAVLIPFFSTFFNEADIKTVQNEARLESEFRAAEIIDGLNIVYLNDIRNRKRLIINSSETNNNGYQVNDKAYVECFKNRNVKSSGLISDSFIPVSVMNSSYCARTIGGWNTWEVGHVQDNLIDESSMLVMSKVADIGERLRAGYSAKVERNNCAIAHQSIKNHSILMYAACMDLEDGGDLNVVTDNYITLVQDTPLSDKALEAIKKEYVDELANAIYEAAIQEAEKVELGKVQHGVAGLAQFLGSGNEYKREYRNAVFRVMNAVSVNTDVEIKKNTLNSFIDYAFNDSLKAEFGSNNDFGLLDYAAELKSEESSKLTLFRTVNVVTGGGASGLGFNYEDCREKGNCAMASPDVLSMAGDATASFLKPAFSIYLTVKIWEGVAKSENNKMFNQNKKVGSTEVTAKVIGNIVLGLIVTVCFFYLLLNYKLYMRQLFRILDWLLMSVVAAFTMLFALFGIFAELIIHRRLTINPFAIIRECGLYDVLFRPLLLCFGWVTLIIMMYISSAVNSILIRLHLEEYIAFYGTAGVVSDIISLIIFNFIYVLAMLVGLHKTIETVDEMISEENESLFSGLKNSLNAADSVFSKIKNLQHAN